MEKGKSAKKAIKKSKGAVKKPKTALKGAKPSAKNAKFFITTAIDYPNSSPHLGHAYEKTVADCISRWHRLCGDDVFFLTGTDEHGKKIEQAALKEGIAPQEFVDGQVGSFKKLCGRWNISYDRFIRTSEPAHMKICRDIFEKV